MYKPLKVELEAGKDYYYCKCGKSASGVFCDGSHKGTGLTPVKFSVNKNQDYYLCTCRKSSEKPFCDGSHSR